jgi:hypothetical protein
MFLNKTVFILGAGASWHYGYPTGEELVREVSTKAFVLGEAFKERFQENKGARPRPNFIARNSSDVVNVETLRKEWEDAYKDCFELGRRLESLDPLVIDYFLGQNPRLQDIGRLLISWVILERESRYLKIPASHNFDATGKDNWYRFILHKLASNCTQSSDLLRNEVSFVTFNYDVSLEYALVRGLRSIALFESGDISKFLNGGRILHIYGKVPSSSGEPIEFGPFDNDMSKRAKYENDVVLKDAHLKELLDKLYQASAKIRVIDPHDKDLDKEVIGLAKAEIERAKCVYILGYGFDELNSRRLELDRALYYEGSTKCVLFTNFRDINRINKRASNLFFHRPNAFSADGMQVEGSIQGGYYYEKSVRDVYEALALDFDSLEDQLLFGTRI